MERLKVTELKALLKSLGLRGYSRLNKADLVKLIMDHFNSRARPVPRPRQLNDPPKDVIKRRPPRPNRTPPQPPQSVRFRPDRPRQPSSQEMDIFEQQEMHKSRPVVISKLNDWYDWLINHVPSTIKDGASRAFKTFKDKIMGFYNRVTGNQTQLEELKGPREPEPEPFNPIELEQAFDGAYRSYGIDGRPRMDADTFFNHIRGEFISLIARELTVLNLVRVQMTTWIRFIKDDAVAPEGDRVELAFNSGMTNVHQGSNLEQIVDEMITHMKTQIENPVLLNSRFKFDEVLFLNANFHWLNLTRGSSYLPLPDWLAGKKAIINPHNNDEECFKWAVIAAENIGMKDPQRVSNLRKFINNYDWSGLEFPASIKDIGVFETKNNISVNMLAVEGRDIYIHKKTNYRSDRDLQGPWGRYATHCEINLLMISENGIWHYTAIKSLSRLLSSSNSKHKCKQYFCTNCLQGFTQESSRDKHQVYCKDKETVRVEMPSKGSTIEVYNGQTQFKVPFMMYADFEAILEPVEGSIPNPKGPYTKDISQHIPSGFCVYSKFAYGEVQNPLNLYRGKDCVEKFCDITSKKKHIGCIICFLKSLWIL